MTSPNSPPASPPAAARPVIVAPDQVPERRGVVAFLSGLVRNGDWVLPRHFRVVAFMGNAELDLTRAHVGAGTSHVEVAAMMGNVTVVVPPELRVECELDAFMASSEVHRRAATATPADAPLVRITGTAIMSSVEVKVVDPNAPGWVDRLLGRRSPARQ